MGNGLIKQNKLNDQEREKSICNDNHVIEIHDMAMQEINNKKIEIIEENYSISDKTSLSICYTGRGSSCASCDQIVNNLSVNNHDKELNGCKLSDNIAENNNMKYVYLEVDNNIYCVDSTNYMEIYYQTILNGEI